jgi:hypothetical protein
MKHWGRFFLASCLVMTTYFLISSSSGISVAEETLETRIQKCINCCAYKKQVCNNIKADLRLCEAVYQECAATCNSEGKSPSEWSECWSQSDK